MVRRLINVALDQETGVVEPSSRIAAFPAVDKTDSKNLAHVFFLLSCYLCNGSEYKKNLI